MVAKQHGVDLREVVALDPDAVTAHLAVEQQILKSIIIRNSQAKYGIDVHLHEKAACFL